LSSRYGLLLLISVIIIQVISAGLLDLRFIFDFPGVEWWDILFTDDGDINVGY